MYSEVPEGVPASDNYNVIVYVAESGLRTNIVSEGMLDCLHAHTLGLIPLPYVDSLVRLSISETH